MSFLHLALVFLACYGLGSLILRLCGIRWSGFWQHAVFAAGCGLGVLANLVFFAGTAGLLSRTSAWVFLGALGVVGGIAAARSWKTLPASPGAGERWKALDFLLAAVLLGAIILNGLTALAPPTAADSINYHFAYPKLYLEQGRVTFILGSLQANIMNLHMLYLLGMILSGAQGAALASWGAGVLLAGTILVAGQRLFGSIRMGLIAAALFYTAPLVTQVAVAGQVEVGLTLFSLLAVLAFVEWAEESFSLGWLVLSGLFAGFAGGTKYFGLFAIVVLALLVAAALAGRGLLGRIVPAVLLFGLTAGVVASPFYVRNAVYTGNPVYPAFYSVFGGRYWSDALDASFRQFVGEHRRPLGRGVLEMLAGPWTLTMRDGIQGYGPVFLSLLPLVPLALWWVRRSKEFRPALALFAFSSLFYLLWFFEAAQRGRHLMPGVAALSLLLALGVSRAIRLGMTPRLVAGGTLLLAIGLGTGFSGVYNAGFLPVAFGAESERSFLERKLWYYKDILWINRHLSRKDRLFPLINPVHFYLDAPYIPTSVHLHGFLDWTRLRDEKDLYRRLRDEGFTHVFIDSAVQSTATGREVDRVRRLERRVGLLFGQLAWRYGEVIYQDERLVPFYRSLDEPKRVIRPVVFRLVDDR